jgi:hypothetical protein
MTRILVAGTASEPMGSCVKPGDSTISDGVFHASLKLGAHANLRGGFSPARAVTARAPAPCLDGGRDALTCNTFQVARLSPLDLARATYPACAAVAGDRGSRRSLRRQRLSGSSPGVCGRVHVKRLDEVPNSAELTGAALPPCRSSRDAGAVRAGTKRTPPIDVSAPSPSTWKAAMPSRSPATKFSSPPSSGIRPPSASVPKTGGPSASQLRGRWPRR